MSPRGVALLAQWEGVETQVYQDARGNQTIGVGHLLTPQEISSGRIDLDGRLVRWTGGLTEEQVYALLAQDLRRFESAVNAHVVAPLEQYQFDALVSFSFNVGAGAFVDSTLLKRLNARAYEEVPEQMRRWVKSNKKRVQGLVNRRENEIRLWLGELSVEQEPEGHGLGPSDVVDESIRLRADLDRALARIEDLGRRVAQLESVAKIPPWGPTIGA